MHLACLMAGASTRLLPLTRDCHKAALKLRQRRMIDYQLDAFQAAGLEQMTFVLGHGAAELAQILFNRLGDQHFTIRNNPHFQSRNLDWSAFLALSSQDGPVIYYEGDLLVPPSLINQVAHSQAEICIAVDSSSRSECVDTLVIAPDGIVTQLMFVEHGQACAQTHPESLGELICFAKLGWRARRYVVDELSHQPFVGPMQLYTIFERAFQRFDTDVIDAHERAWVEVDNAGDLARAAAHADLILES